jgi:hypothetical protein
MGKVMPASLIESALATLDRALSAGLLALVFIPSLPVFLLVLPRCPARSPLLETVTCPGNWQVELIAMSSPFLVAFL